MSAERFVVTKADEEVKQVPITSKSEAFDVSEEKETFMPNSLTEQDKILAKSASPGKISKHSVPSGSKISSTLPKENVNYALYEEEIQERPRITTFLKTLANYSTVAEIVEEESDSRTAVAGCAPDRRPKVVRLGTLMGVFLPCVQNILGVILFVRLTWIVGMAGIVQGFFIVFLCVCTTLLTSISMSAIATNGVVPAGGSYFMISRALGPEFGGAVGLLFYLGTTYASSLYILGAVEILLTYISPELSLFGEFTGPENRNNLFNNYRVYGSIFLMLMSVVVFVGVQVVNKFASLFLACVIVSIISMYSGMIKSAFLPPDVTVCFLGDRLLRQLQGDKLCSKFTRNSTTNESMPTTLYRQFCSRNESSASWTCDAFFDANELTEMLGVPGLGSVSDTVESSYLFMDDYITDSGLSSVPVVPEIRDPNIVVADLTVSFTVLLAIFFPSVTGIMAGSNRSGDLKDGQRSIPRGTIGAVVTTGIIYLSSSVLFGLCVHGALLRDKFGESLGNELIVSIIAWPNKWVVLVGAFMSTIGAGLQSLTGAPRLLQAIAKDGIIPILKPFSFGKKNGEPTWALLLTFIISESGILIANLDLVAPIITMFFLMCYMFVNLACALHSLLKAPNWRPRFKFYHWLLSLVGGGLCIALMFISSWYYALAALAIAATIYKYIEYSGAKKEWGDGLRGLQLTTARFALLRLASGPPHTKNWRPQLLVLMKLDIIHELRSSRLLAFAQQLKAGKGLTVVASVIEGNSLESAEVAKKAEQLLASAIDEHKIKGFQQVLVARNVEEGISAVIQTAGLGGLSPNTVVVAWPFPEPHKRDHSNSSIFLRAVHEAYAQHDAVLVPKYISKFPSDSLEPGGTIDVWWIVHDGGLLMLLPFLLKQHKVWRYCKTRIFTVAQMEDNSLQLMTDLQTFIYHLRIDALVEVIEMEDSDISAYTYERTLRMEQRTEILQKLQLTRRESLNDVTEILERSRRFPAGHPHSGHKKIAPLSSFDKLPRFNPDKNNESDTEMEFPGNERGSEPAKSPEMTWTVEDMQISIDVPGSDKLSAGVSISSSITKPKTTNVRRMHTAIKLNEAIVSKSIDASLVILNLPGPPKTSDRNAEANYMEYIEVLTEKLDRVLLVRGGGREVVTMYS